MATLNLKTLITASALALTLSACATREPESEPMPESQGPSQAEIDAERARAAEEARRANQQALDRARGLLRDAKQYTNLNAGQRGRLADGERAIGANEGERAVSVLSRLLSELRAARMTYTVVQGDSLWRIAGKSDVYGNPYQWPLIYKANTDQIDDADLIHPDQRLNVTMHPMQQDVDMAVEHAKNRGAWDIGRTEDSDRAYLGR